MTCWVAGDPSALVMTVERDAHPAIPTGSKHSKTVLFRIVTPMTMTLGASFCNGADTNFDGMCYQQLLVTIGKAKSGVEQV
jgi:hypothetical protein